jgi:4-hydroxy-tetrahydrodipicolinate synthase/2-dehydro-3-deoxy-D-gluconate aldolase
MKPQIITPMMTPFNERGEIDYSLTEKLLDRLAEFKVDGIFPLGSTGLFPWLSLAERKKFLEFVASKTHIKIYAGVGSASYNESLEMARLANDLGCDSGVVMPPFYIIPGMDEMKNYFSSLFSRVPMRFYLYNIPQLSGAYIPQSLPALLAAEFSNVVGIKDSSADMRYFSKMVQNRPDHFLVFQGQDDLLLPSLSLGGDGGVCGTSNISKIILSVRDRFADGSMKDATSLQIEGVDPLMDSLNAARFPSGYYYALYMSFGVNGGYRIPMLEPSPETKRNIDENMLKANSIQ